MDSIANNNFTFLIKEYEKLKDEQHKRIEFRDHMIYLTLAAIGSVFSFAIEKPDLAIAYLVLPFICLVLGWTYFTNDEKITAIGNYIRKHLVPQINQQNSERASPLSDTWDDLLRKDSTRKHRKWFQFFIDISIFCLSGIISLVTFFVFNEFTYWFHILIAGFESVCILYLSIQFWRNADVD